MLSSVAIGLVEVTELCDYNIIICSTHYTNYKLQGMSSLRSLIPFRVSHLLVASANA